MALGGSSTNINGLAHDKRRCTALHTDSLMMAVKHVSIVYVSRSAIKFIGNGTGHDALKGRPESKKKP